MVSPNTLSARFLSFAIVATLAAALLAAFRWPVNGLTLYEQWRERHSGHIFYRGPAGSRAIALTFDDGPDPRYTGRVLDILRKYHIKATFFLVGKRVDQYPELARRIVAEGHQVANHTLTHPEFERDSDSSGRREIDECQRIIERVCGVRTALFRPPRGLWNAGEFRQVEREGMRVVLWSLAYDRSAERDSRRLRERVIKLARRGDIILLHDGSASRMDERGSMIRELDSLIAGLRSKGFQFATAPQLLRLPENRAVRTARR